jgi:ribosomal protein S18 acetylase RimI-like enzyme
MDFFAEYEQYHGEFFDTGTLKDADLSARFLRSMESENSATFIALLDENVVGYISITIREQPQFYKIKKIGAISGLMVAKGYRRKGIATRLLAQAKVYFMQRGIQYYTVYTATANQGAVRFYEQNGLAVLHTIFIGELGTG